METLSYIILILLTLVGYSAGVAKRAGKKDVLEPQLIDMAIILILWGVAIYSRSSFGLNKWLFILIFVVVGFFSGYLAYWSRRTREEPSPEDKPSQKRLWPMWKAFSKRMGGFQSRVFLSLLFFIFVAPFALAIKAFSDPLNIKHKKKGTHWLERKEALAGLEEFKRQF